MPPSFCQLPTANCQLPKNHWLTFARFVHLYSGSASGGMGKRVNNSHHRIYLRAYPCHPTTTYAKCPF